MPGMELGEGTRGLNRSPVPTQAAVLLHMVTSVQTACSHLQVPSNRPNEQLLDRSQSDSSLRGPPADMHSSTSGEPAEEFLSELTRSLKTTVFFAQSIYFC